MLQYLQKLKGERRVIVVFGAPGERDKEKRPLMGKTVDAFADAIIVTDDDPARENRWHILRDVAAGVERDVGTSFWIIPGRTHAITHAARIAQPGDIVLLAGIGHQDVLDTNFGYIPRSEQ
jgi:UDP-N-acetylmuramoyl-L-alanyl-D-glutamate--2,6-diaminopimelate ligase